MERNYTYSHRARQERLELRRKQAFRRRVRTLSTVFVFVFIFISVISANAIIANAGQGYEKEYQKLYTSVVVESGETVWAIAAENMTAGYESINMLIEEIGFINSLDESYTIQTGTVLIVPYYGEV